MPFPAASEAGPRVELSYEQAVSLVAHWLVEGDIKNARALVGLLDTQYPDDLEVSFLVAQTDIAEIGARSRNRTGMAYLRPRDFKSSSPSKQQERAALYN